MITLPWPDRNLHPNARVHWAVKARATKAARREGYYAAKVAAVKVPEGDLILRMGFYPPDKRKRDDDGLVAAFKPYRDGIADALGIDDSRFKCDPVMMEPQKGGCVRVTIEEK